MPLDCCNSGVLTGPQHEPDSQILCMINLTGYDTGYDKPNRRIRQKVEAVTKPRKVCHCQYIKSRDSKKKGPIAHSRDVAHDHVSSETIKTIACKGGKLN